MTVYLDTSSLIKLYVEEPGSDAVLQLIDDATVVSTSLVAYPETRAALARLRREGRLAAAAFRTAKRDFEQQWHAYLSIEPTVTVCLEAGELAERYGLRGFDAIHLASFAEIARRAGIERTRFSSFDDRLTRAARRLRRTLLADSRDHRTP